MKKIIIVLTSHDQLGTTGKRTGAYLSEITHPYEQFINAGYEVDFVSPKGGQAPLDGVNLDDAINKKWIDNSEFKKKVAATQKASEVNFKSYSAIFFAGGHGAMFDLPNDKELARLTVQIYENNGVVGAVCHGLAGLVNVKLSDGSYLVNDKKVSSFSNAEEEAVQLTGQMPFLLESLLKERGGIYSKAPNFEPHAVADKRLVTGQNPASAAEVAKKMVINLSK